MSCRTRLYSIEAWSGLECVGWSTGCQARGLRRREEHFVADLGADRIYVRRESTPGAASELVASWTPGRGWTLEAQADSSTVAQLAVLVAER